MKYTLIGLSGTFAGGKDTLAKRLEGQYTHVPTGDIVRKVAMREYGSIERDVLQKTATRYRHEHGAGYFVETAINESPRPLIISGIRSLGEAQAVRDAGGVIVYIDAPAEVRYERMKLRNRDAEVELSLEEFIRQEEKELVGDLEDMSAFNMREIGRCADITIQNDSTVEAFYEQAKQLLGVDITQ